MDGDADRPRPARRWRAAIWLACVVVGAVAAFLEVWPDTPSPPPGALATRWDEIDWGDAVVLTVSFALSARLLVSVLRMLRRLGAVLRRRPPALDIERPTRSRAGPPTRANPTSSSSPSARGHAVLVRVYQLPPSSCLDP